MRSFLSATLILFLSVVNGQIPAYYSSIDFSQTGLALKNDLATLITSTHTTPISYADVWDVLKVSDLDPTNSAKVLLIYGYNDSDGSLVNDRTRDKNNSGGSSGQWNREHVFAKSLGNPDLGTVGPGSDAHNLRSSDVDMNNDRGSLLFATGSGNAGNVGGNWYPGDEWKGDCARIVMYMYLRYGLQCRPYFVGSGTTNSVDANMVNLFLDWNAADPVSEIEENRNNEIQSWQGNRNPFIDNPYIATSIWGGTPAEDTWGGLGTGEQQEMQLSVYPVPSADHQVYVHSASLQEIVSVRIYDAKGNQAGQYNLEEMYAGTLHITDIPSGFWMLQIETDSAVINRKIIIQ